MAAGERRADVRVLRAQGVGCARGRGSESGVWPWTPALRPVAPAFRVPRHLGSTVTLAGRSRSVPNARRLDMAARDDLASERVAHVGEDLIVVAKQTSRRERGAVEPDRAQAGLETASKTIG